MKIEKHIFRGFLNDQFGYPVQEVWYYDIRDIHNGGGVIISQPGNFGGPYPERHIAELAADIAYHGRVRL